MTGVSVSALVLAGGRARRMGGIDKRELVVDGKSIFQRQCDVLRDRVAEILVSSTKPVAGFRTVVDAIDEGGPVAGIAAGLAAARTEWLLVVAGDMPYISGVLIDRMLGRVLAGRLAGSGPAGEVDVVGLRVGELPEPLFAVWRVATCRSVVEARVASRQLKASRLLTDAGLRVAWIEQAELREIDPTLRMLANINEPRDL